ncbi:MAG TPA: biotin synthase BioB [Gemmatimonadaceae bacterium]|jgi:biotin synthase
MTNALPNWNTLADRSLAGELISRDDALAVLRAPDELLLDQLAAAYRVRRHHFGNRVRLHFLLNAQSGLCPEDCHYCSQSSVSMAEIEKYPFMAREKILAAADRAASLNVGTFCMVISGRAPGGRVFDKVLDAVREVKAKHDMHVCACLGLLTEEHVRQLEAAGVDQVNHNLNSSERFTEEIVTTHEYGDRVATVEHVARSNMKTCSGGIIGMGETDDDVVDLALSLRELNVRSVPVNFLIPIPGTPFEGKQGLDPRRCLRVLALYRFILPSQEIRIAGGREVHLRSMQALGLYAANSIFIGDYLTTPGQAARADYEMIRDAGFVLESPDGEPLAPERLDELLDGSVAPGAEVVSV